MRRALWCWLAAILCAGMEALARSSSPRGKEPPDHTPPVLKYCGDDLKRLCPDSSKVFELYCLYENKNQLSDACRDYLGSTTMGGCNDEAMALCNDYESVPDITSCLYNHSQSLSEDCLRNLQNSKEVTNPLVEEQEQFLHATMASALISFVALSLPLLAFLWALHMWYNLYLEQRRVLRAPREYIKAHSEVLQLIRACDRILSAQSADSSASPAASSEADHSWTLSFRSISFWTEERDPVLPFVSMDKQERKQILHEISGECRAKTITAIMGPSGSGKTTLLKLLGGQTYNGQYAGHRAINGHIFQQRQYDEIMRRQGFVAQGDHLLSSLTVWQTLLFAAMLRLPDEMTVHHKFCRAAHVMHDLGLSAAAHVPVGGSGGSTGGGGAPAAGSGGKGISGGQRRRLSIALEVLSNPSTLLLDEPTSGLDAASTLRIVQVLRNMTRTYRTTIALTIHQPRAEVFELFDSLILLGSGGYLVYCGDCHQAVPVLSSAPCIQLRDCSYTNPGDFIIDILGLSTEADTDDRSSPAMDANDESSPVGSPMLRETGSDDSNSMDSSSHHLLSGHQTIDEELSYADDRAPRSNAGNGEGSEEKSTEDGLARARQREDGVDDSLRQSQTLQLRDYFCRTATFLQLDAQLAAMVYSHREGNASDGRDAGPSGEGIELLPLSTPSHNSLRSPAHRNHDAYDRLSSLEDNMPDSPARVPRNQSRTAMHPLSVFGGGSIHSAEDRLRWKLERSPYPASFLTQLYVLAARRSLAYLPSIRELCEFAVQISVVCVIVAYTFSYQVSSEIEAPYQVLMLLSIISLYLMIIQYLQLIPEYMNERVIVLAEMGAKYVGTTAYLMSAVITEIPRAILQTILLMYLLYTLHPLNPNIENFAYSMACTMMGLAAWQSLISLCAMATDVTAVAYSMLFLVLGSGTLFGGLLVRYSKLPALFRPFYYLSVAAVTQRALISNDLRCCYLTATCNSISHDLNLAQEDGSSSSYLTEHHAYSERRSLVDELWSTLDSATTSTTWLGMDAIQAANDETWNATQATSTTFCPPGLEFTGDGSDLGNLGRLYLLGLDLQHEHPLVSILFLLVAAVACRLCALATLSLRQAWKDQLMEADSPSS